MSKVFISYRHDDEPFATRQICDCLCDKFGRENVFMDCHNIPFGVDFVEHLEDAVQKCDILLAVIGEKWLSLLAQKLADSKPDFVQVEISAALKRGIPVIPVLIGEATLPAEDALPIDLQSLSPRNATEVRAGRDMDDHLSRLTNGIHSLLVCPQPSSEREPSTPLTTASESVEGTCLCCGHEGSLRTISPPGTPRHMEMVECAHTIDANSPTEQCGFTFLREHLTTNRLCFATLGHITSGKTLWLAMVCRELINGFVPQDNEVETIESRKTAELDRIADDILEHRIPPAPTQMVPLPHPFIFSFFDKKSWRKSSSLITIFDYSGEITSSVDLQDSHRYRALQADGYLFFIDPTMPSERQAKALVNLRNDLRIVKNVKHGKQLRVPIALCLSKIDLLPSQNYAERGERGVGRFYRELQESDPEGALDGALDLRTIQKRSEMTEKLTSAIWPEWDIRKQLEGMFGNRFLLFPLSSVGVENLGETDLGNRGICPYAIHAPILWLLKMNGYRVF